MQKSHEQNKTMIFHSSKWPNHAMELTPGRRPVQFLDD